MGTRNLTMVVKDGEYKVAQYCQWDGYPSGQGATVLNFLKNEMDLNRFKDAVSQVRNFSVEDVKERWVEAGANPDESWVSMDVSNNFRKTYPHLHRDHGADILATIQNTNGDMGVFLETEFANDSLFCEWAYLVNLDNETLEVYKGFNKEPLEAGDRFYQENPDDRGYFPIRLVKTYHFSELPDEETFCNDLNPPEDD